jgi:hypothetical protein
MLGGDQGTEVERCSDRGRSCTAYIRSQKGGMCVEFHAFGQIITVADQEEVRKTAPLPTSRELWYPPNAAHPTSPTANAAGD